MTLPLNGGVSVALSNGSLEIMMIDILRATGLLGIGLILGLFVAVFFVAAPGKEISFWGIRYHKKWAPPWNWRKWKRIPKKLHPDCESVLLAFSVYDSDRISTEDLYRVASDMSKLSRIEAREALIKLEKIGIVTCSMGECRVLEKGVPLVAKMQRERLE